MRLSFSEPYTATNAPFFSARDARLCGGCYSPGCITYRRSTPVTQASRLAADRSGRPFRRLYDPEDELGRQRVRNGPLARRHANRPYATTHSGQEVEHGAGVVAG